MPQCREPVAPDAAALLPLDAATLLPLMPQCRDSAAPDAAALLPLMLQPCAARIHPAMMSVVTECRDSDTKMRASFRMDCAEIKAEH